MNEAELLKNYEKVQGELKRKFCLKDKNFGCSWELCDNCKSIEDDFKQILNKTDFMKVQNEWEEFNINFPRGASPKFIAEISEYVCKKGYRGLMCSSGSYYVKVKFFSEKKE